MGKTRVFLTMRAKRGMEMGMKQCLVIAVALMCAGNMSLAEAGVSKRLDKTSGMCRELNFYNSGWMSEGHDLFKSNCKSCHNRKNEKKAPFLYEESLTMEGWNLVFYRKYAPCAKDGSWSNLSREQLLRVNDYLYWNAFGTYDANTAERCG